MVTIVFESHGTTFDNEADLSSGVYDVALSPLGEKQAQDLGERHKDESFAAIFCSVLQRSYRSAEIAFAGRNFKIIKDQRLNESNYGDFTRYPYNKVKAIKGDYITKPFPNGDSFEQRSQEMKSFLQDLLKDYDGQKVMIIGHRATQYSLEYWINSVSLKEAVTAPWHWQPGWIYRFKEI